MRTKRSVLFIGLLILPVFALLMPAAEVRLAWEAPASADGGPVEDLAGFLVCYGTESGNYASVVDVGMEMTAALQDLDPHTTYYIAVKSYDRSGIQSTASDELSWVFDANANGLPDEWEMNYFGGISVAGGGVDEDFSGNGFSNGDAFVAGTDPTNPLDVPAVGMRMENGTMMLTFQTVVAAGPAYAGRSRVYRVEQCRDVARGEWTPLEGHDHIVATGSRVDVPVPAGTAGVNFYRVRIHLN